jgi:hypothetical protein
MFSKNNVSQSMIDAVESVLVEDKKLLLEPEDEKKDRKKNDEVKEELKGNQVKLDKNHNGKLDSQDFKLLRMKKEGVLDAIKSGAKKVMDKVAPGDDELLKSLEKETGGKRPNMYNKPKNEEIEQVEERTLTPGETAEKERIVKSMKKGLAGFKARYGDRAKSVMYATATKQAMKEENESLDEANTESKKEFVARQARLAAAGAQTAKDPERLKRMMKIPGYAAAMGLAKKTTKEEVETVEEDIGAMQSVVGENKGKKAVRVDTLKGISVTTDPEVKNANAHFSGKSATLKAEGKGTDTAVPFVTDSATHKEIDRAVKPTFKKIKEMLGKTGTSE